MYSLLFHLLLNLSRDLFQPAFRFFFLNDPAPPEIYPLPLHAALPISQCALGAVPDLPAVPDVQQAGDLQLVVAEGGADAAGPVVVRILHDAQVGVLHGEPVRADRSEEHTSELQSLAYLVCRLLLEKKK